MSKFVHLHVHTIYSLLDGANNIKDLVGKVKNMGMTACAITDHGNMFGVVDFYKECKAQGIKPLLGCEVYVAPYGSSRFDKSAKDSNDWKDSRYNHLLLIAKDNDGYKNLCKIVSAGWTEGFYYKPRVDIDLLKQYHEGLVCTSACLAGAIPQALLGSGYDKALQIAKEYQDIFGKEDFYIEIQDHGIKEQALTNPDLIRIAHEIGAKLVATNDAHYLNKEDAAAHDVLLCIQTSHKLKDENRMRFETDEFYVKSEEEMRALFPYCQEAIDNTAEIAEKCNVEFEFGKVKLPDYEIPAEFATHLDYFKHLCYTGMTRRYGENPPQEYVDRLEYEIDVINRMNFVGYYLIVWDYINFAKTHDIPVGAGRGSGAGSIAAYCMGITNIDPMKYNLLFERFLNPERISMPDFDIDFCYNRRHEVLEYVTRKYGAERVSQIVTFGTMAAKNSIRDVARVMDIPYAEADRIAKMIPGDPKMTIEKAMELNPEFKSEYETNPQTKEVIDMALKLEGTPRQSSKHACGVLIADKDITEYAPLMTAEDKDTGKMEVVIQFPMTTLEELGLVKMDFLGLRTLTVIKDTVNAIKKHYGVDIDIDNLDPDNYPEIYEMMVNQDTIGIFQFESSGMVSMLKQMFFDIDRVNSVKTDEERKALGHEFFERLIAGISLYRPGPMDYIPDYINGLKDPANVTYDCPELKHILQNTYGTIVYQEQVMQIVRDLGGYSMGRSDLVRRAMGKKKQYIMDAEKEVFLHGNASSKKDDEALVNGCVNNGIDENVAIRIWDKMVDFAKYAFNKSHAACYAYIAVQTAFLKKYYPEEFMAATLTSVIGNNDKLSFYCNASQKTLGINILNPDINESEAGFTTSAKNIRFGLEGIKSVGGILANEIIAERANGPYTSFFDFAVRLSNKGLNKSAIEALIKSGAFDSTGFNRAELLSAYPEIVSAAKRECEEKASGQVSLFDFIEDKTEDFKCPDIKHMADLPQETKLKYEKEVTSLYISGHPLYKYSKAMEAAKSITIREIKESLENGETRFANKAQVNIAVILLDVKRKLTKNGTTMVTCSIQDVDSEASMIAFSRTLESYEPLFKNEQVALVKATVDPRDDGSITFIANSLYLMPSDSDDENAFSVFAKEVAPRGYYNARNSYQPAPKAPAAPTAPVTPAASSQPAKSSGKSFPKGLYLKMNKKSDLRDFVNALSVSRGQTAVYIYCVEEKKYYHNPSLKVNINDPALISSVKALVSDPQKEIKIIR